MCLHFIGSKKFQLNCNFLQLPTFLQPALLVTTCDIVGRQLFHFCFTSSMCTCQLGSLTRTSLALCVLFFHAVLTVAEEALLSDCQDLPDPNQTVHLSSTWQHHQGHAHLQEGRACYGSGQTLPQPRARARL